MSNIFGKLDFWVFVVGVFFVCRAFPYVTFYWERYATVKRVTIKRFVNVQKACDLLIAMYHTLKLFTGLWLSILGAWGFFTVIVPVAVSYIMPIVLLVLYVIYYNIRGSVISKHGLNEFKEKLVKYRAKLEPVTDENDYEVMFIRAHNRVDEHSLTVLLYIALIIGIMICY